MRTPLTYPGVIRVVPADTWEIARSKREAPACRRGECHKEAFQHFDIGYGTTLAVISMVLMLALGAVYLRQQAAQGVYQ